MSENVSEMGEKFAYELNLLISRDKSEAELLFAIVDLNKYIVLFITAGLGNIN